jgi:hypothetical protein
MTDLFLIAHKVRGEATFDVATQMECPHCVNGQVVAINKDELIACHECDSLGYWWIIPTSGHRAYPWWHQALDGLGQGSDIGFWPDPIIDEMPSALPDHYTTKAEPKIDLASALGIMARIHAPTPPIKRRF